jgi:two-component system sensor histidine kinase RegB
VTSPEAIALDWFVRVRWALGIGGAVLIGAVTLLTDSGLDVAPMLVFAGYVVVSNLAFVSLRAWADGERRGLGPLLLVDTLALTASLALSGGPENPFTVLFLVYVALASVVLGNRWAWTLAAMTVACFGLLFVFTPAGSGAMSHGAHGAHAGHAAHSQFSTHLYGMLFAFAVTSGIVAYLGTRLTAALALRDRQLTEARARATRSERLASLTTLAAGAAHEMSTPLATIAVVASELEHRAKELPDGGDLADEARLILAEVGRCRTILDQLGQERGEGRGEAPELITPNALVETVATRLTDDRRERLARDIAPSLPQLSVPKRAFATVLGNLIDNAFEASGANEHVTVSVAPTGGGIRFTVRDEGRGMSEQERERAVEPFFSTKPEGQRMGLGLFLARTVTEELGGSFDLTSTEGRGTTVSVEIPT